MEPFNTEVETIASCLNRLNFFFQTNNVPDDKKAQTMITMLSAERYALLRNFVDPQKPKDKSFRVLTAIPEKKLNPKPLVISVRFSFHKRNEMGEFGGVCVQLKKLSTNREFG
ncbi:hypothetical protein AVEN_50159-1 [Araneus ventricosus]|uniref:Uncharacterized protein n=1 Tax=Araneus ventricosus TaxID=182803 RepID=A0A4Y2U8M7_ARAVE|nr:hypothetical protein AVEN_50159-1 [Araneus ventricosus]